MDIWGLEDYDVVFLSLASLRPSQLGSLGGRSSFPVR